MLFSVQRNPFLFIIAVFSITAFLSIIAGLQYIGYIEQGEMEPVVPSTFSGIAILLLYILGATAVILLIIYFHLPLIGIIEAFALFFSMLILFDALFGLPLSLILPLLFTGLRFAYPSLLTKNLALIFAISGASSIIGASLSLKYSLLFLLIIALYDFIAVFITKHMIYLAKGIQPKKRAFTASIPSQKRIYQIGGGDFAIPLIIAISSIKFSWISCFSILLGSLIGMLLTFYFVYKKDIPMPGLPLIGAGACLGLFVGAVI